MPSVPAIETSESLGKRGSSPAAPPRAIAVDYASALGMPRWREALAWPVALADSYALGRTRLTQMTEAVSGMPPGDARLIAMASCGQVIANALPLLDMGRTLSAARQRNLQLDSVAPEVACLRGDAALETLPAFRFRRPHAPPRHAALRRWARTRSWSPWARLPQALLYPSAVAITHNELLHEAAANDGSAVGFYHAESLLAAARAAAAPGLPEEARQHAAGVLAGAMPPDATLDGDLVGRVAALIAMRIEAITRAAAADLAGMRTLRRLPAAIWAGSGGHWPTRIAALEALRRGGDVTLFDHGYNRALHDILEFPALIDLFVARTLVMPTERMAERIRGSRLRALLPMDHGATVVGRRRDRGMAELVRTTRRAPATHERPRILYAPHILRGLRQTVPASPPDLIYLDWQFRLMEVLLDAPVNVLVRPHPQGIFAGKPHPLAAIVKTEARPFEALLPQADVLLFDSPYSRVFCKSLLTDRPIVFIDFGMPYFGTDIAPMIERRCRVLRVAYDERNIPHVDRQALASALCDPASPAADSVMFFRRLMVGEDA